ncbi:molybdate ABC transporter substrate-binding protein [Rhodoplanes sp. Z2-YC6860]|uniref:molybdate ABC transporter substrate-binding protein n=1 Tax=Rhodoplanes sp. Z2-YC6860 TaxID=674703 RepID=UPI00078D654F|nr:substrate-binding domain-containing protein [Rhodoplanes sp. Z2-YC6860]AMN40274.1 ABC transporter substrate-binding protein [Rhodoplanes sp. Z2-YC6860]
MVPLSLYRTGLLLAALVTALPAGAAEVNVIAAGAVRGIVGGMIDDYAKQTGHKFNFTVGPTGMLRDAIASGKPTDLVIVSAPLMADLEKTGKITPGSRIELGRVGLGIVVRAGAPIPDVSTPDAVKTLLLKAKSIAYTDPKLGATSSTHLLKIAENFGIKDDVVRKGLLATGGNDAAEKVANGEAEIAIAPISDVHAKDARIAGALPEAIQLWTVYAAAIPTSSAEPKEARAFVTALTASTLRERWVKAGWEPVAK